MATVTACVLAAAWLYDRYDFAVRWPAKVQQETIGGTAASSHTLISKERHFAFGEGLARWRYRADASNVALQRLCGSVEVGRCTFTRTRRVENGVELTVSLSGGVLTVEEWWS